MVALVRKILLLWLLLVSHTLFATSHQIIPEVHRTKSKQAKAEPLTVQTMSIVQQAIKESPVLSLDALLKQQQSVVRLTHNSGDESQSALSIRGFGDNAAANSLILIDGFPLTNPTLFAPNLNSIALLDVAKITIIQGSEGSLWGDQAVGGVVLIETRHPERFLRDALLGIGNMNTKFFSALLGNKFTQGIYLKVFGFSNTTSHYRHHNQEEDNNIRLSAGIDYASGTIGTNLQSYSTQINFPGGLTREQFHENPRQAADSSNHFNYKTQLMQLINKQGMTNQFILETRLAYQGITGDGVIFRPSHSNEWQSNVEPRLIGRIEGNKITLGYYGLASGYHLQNLFAQNKAHAAQHHLFLQTLIPFLNRYELTLGSRAALQTMRAQKIIGEIIRSQSHIWVGEVGLNVRPNQAWQFFLRRDGNFRFVKANEATWTQPNVKLNAQEGISYEAGALWNTAWQKAQLSLFALNLENELAFDPRQTPDEPFGSFSNFPHTRRIGVTLSEHYQPGSTVTLDGQLNYVNARFSAGTFKGKQIPGVPAWNGNLNLAYEFMPGWFFKYYVLYTGTRFASDDDENQSEMLPPYWLNGLIMQYMLNPFSVNVEVENLFNQTYATYALYNTESNETFFYPGTGRAFLLTFKLNID